MRVRVKSVLSLLYIDSTLQYMVAPKSPEKATVRAAFPGLGGLCEAARVLHQQQGNKE